MVRAALWAPLALLAALTPFASADIEFTSPKPGDKLTGGEAIEIKWKDSGEAPALADLTTYEIFLWAGGNGEGESIQVSAITTGAQPFIPDSNIFSKVIDKTIGASTPLNAYFLRMVSTSSKGGQVINFSPRFSLTGMTGTFPQVVIDGMKNVQGTAGPDRIDSTGQGAAAAPGANEFDVEYTMQTGLTRYAPMQPVPPTKITKKEATPLHPTSSVAIAKTFLPKPRQLTTITQSGTFSISSRENTAAPAPMPTDDMAKFLARWKD